MKEQGKIVTAGEQIKLNAAAKRKKRKGTLKRLDSIFLAE
jgi:hypothetical protein